MTLEERINVIRELEGRLGSRIITYITSTRSGLEVGMAMDCVRKIYDHILSFNAQKNQLKVDLFLSSNGGDGTVPWRLVTLIRAYASQFRVIVPHRAFSAATLTALGADSIIMHPMGMLGPTDPTVANEFNPRDPDTKRVLGISVEDVSAYISLLKEDVGIRHEDTLVKGFASLSEKVHPLALGNVKRLQAQSRMLARKLLTLHSNRTTQKGKIDEIVDNLTSKLYFHGHPINRDEARDLKLSVGKIDRAIEDSIWKLYAAYEQEMLLDQKFNHLEKFIANNANIAVNTPTLWPIHPKTIGAMVESDKITDVFSFDHQVLGMKDQNGAYQATLLTNRQDWERLPMRP